MNEKTEKLSPADAKLIGALAEFRDALKDGVPLAERFTVRTIKLNLRPSEHGPDDVRRIRKEVLGASQRVFATFLGVSVGAVRGWEQGLKKPSGAACRLMDEIVFSPDHWRKRLLESATSRTDKP